MRPILSSFIVVIALSGCAQVEGLMGRSGGTGGVESAAPEPGQAHPRARPDAAAPSNEAKRAEDFDTASEEQRSAARSGAQAGRGAVDLGVTIASLGAPGEPGFWLKTPLVDAPAKGRVEYPAGGTSASVDLIPLDAARGAGSQMSLSAMRLIEADLTGLPELRVYRLSE
ncbi:MAG: hypothetical protein ACQEVT_15110 [Pseudomonadota bacterium]|uniref:hypothetical protein n=1 Tax=Roseovarius TaxID=74030 RepID=UPI0022A8B020|nr:hypothetical protein [Roseovarius sp. EGI FJ00037]MCZ0811941.1 hypothetical protein [Roseovarius sp. EGI FJ00037]